ncbi:DUF1064 domain-containing protein [Breznakia sp. OttesenSCG-928-G09]|nr:DUF1064 domain-containing protein [Breznakia sp. OttesenSCG-928-G09]
MGYSKYRAKKTVVDGITFDSKAEARHYQELKLLERAGLIKELELQPKYELQPSFKKNGKTVRAINYVADFRYFDVRENKTIVVDVKGMKTPVYELKKKMVEYRYGVDIKEVRG